MAPKKRPNDPKLLQQQLQSRCVTKSGKLSVAPPASFKKFFIILLMHVCKKLLLIETSYKLGIYICGVTVGSLVTDIIPPPKFVLADRHNILNKFFTKIGWGWTGGMLLIFIYLTGMTVSCGNKNLVKRHMIRIAFAAAYWFICTTFFDYIEHLTGFCTQPDSMTKKQCRSNNGTWLAFDISGHAFLLVHCLLTISEEAKVVNGWERIESVIMTEEDAPSDRMTSVELSQLKAYFQSYTPYIRLLIVLLTINVILWEMMLLATTLYFHNMPQKLAGVMFAALGWFITYQVGYKLDFDFAYAPVTVGKGFIKYTKDDK